MLFLSKTVFFGGEGENAVAAIAIGLQGGEGGEAPTSIKQPIILSRFGGGGKSPVKAALANPPLLVRWSDRTPKEDTRRPPPPFPLLRSSLRRPDMQQKNKRKRKRRGRFFMAVKVLRSRKRGPKEDGDLTSSLVLDFSYYCGTI